jgi:hypothetical protein
MTSKKMEELKKEDLMSLKYILAGSLVFTFVSPTLAATEFYIVRGPDKKCEVVETKPTTSTTVIVGNKAYTTRKEAEAQLTTVCHD